MKNYYGFVVFKILSVESVEEKEIEDDEHNSPSHTVDVKKRLQNHLTSFQSSSSVKET